MLRPTDLRLAHIWNDFGECALCGVEDCRTGNAPCSGKVSAKKTTLAKRPETGPMQFGDDWPGIFIRGEHAFAIAMGLEQLVRAAPVTAALAQLQAAGAIALLRSCIVSSEKDIEAPKGTQRALLLE